MVNVLYLGANEVIQRQILERCYLAGRLETELDAEFEKWMLRFRQPGDILVVHSADATGVLDYLDRHNYLAERFGNKVLVVYPSDYNAEGTPEIDFDKNYRQKFSELGINSWWCVPESTEIGLYRIFNPVKVR